MQCVNCQFENMPGTPACVRCGTSLRLATAVLSVEPPRATKWRKAVRRWMPLRGVYYPLRSAVVAMGHSTGAAIARDLRVRWPPLAAVARMIVPGWPQWYLGNGERGRIFATIWLCSLLFGLITFGSTLGSIALGTAFAAHAASILDVLIPNNMAERRAIVVAFLIPFVLLLPIYVSTGWAASRVLSSRQLLQTTEPFASGDVLLFRPFAAGAVSPQPGDVVLYRNVPYRMTADRRTHRQTLYRIDGEWADRIIAGPGSTVLWENGTMSVDGRPSPWLPLNPAALPSHVEIVLPDDTYCIFPTTNPYVSAVQADGIPSSAMVRRSQLVGKIVARNYPIWRWWWVR